VHTNLYIHIIQKTYIYTYYYRLHIGYSLIINFVDS